MGNYDAWNWASGTVTSSTIAYNTNGTGAFSVGIFGATKRGRFSLQWRYKQDPMPHRTQTGYIGNGWIQYDTENTREEAELTLKGMISTYPTADWKIEETP